VDPAKYRPKEEVEEWLRKDPVSLFKAELFREHILTEADIQQIESQVQAEIDEAVRFAKESPYPAPEEALEDVYA
jgi:TPP-dependent pyruvate/acetoin dehydrogenase alpha subunit